MDYEFFGMLVALVFGWIGLLIVITLLCMWSNFVSHMALNAFGGWKVFMEFVRWRQSGRVPPTPTEKDL